MPGQSVSDYRYFKEGGYFYEFSTLCRRADEQGRALL